MTIILRMSTLMLAAGLVAAQAQPADPPAPPPADAIPDIVPRVMNDTAAYCEELRGDIARIRATRGQIPPEAAMLSHEGERMCKIGHIRPGIYRLRTALMILRRQD